MKPLDIYDTNTIAFPRLGLEFEISDTAFTLFGLEIKWYIQISSSAHTAK